VAWHPSRAAVGLRERCRLGHIRVVDHACRLRSAASLQRPRRGRRRRLAMVCPLASVSVEEMGLLEYSTEQNQSCLRRVCRQSRWLMRHVPSPAGLEAPARLGPSHRTQGERIAKALVGLSKTLSLESVPPASRARDARYGMRRGESSACSRSSQPVAKSSQPRETVGKYPAVAGVHDKGLGRGMQPLGSDCQEGARQVCDCGFEAAVESSSTSQAGDARRSAGQWVVVGRMKGSPRELRRIGRARSLSNLLCRGPSPK
jgi:hypothetical protein